MSSMSLTLGASERRAASEIVGLVLLFGMVLVGAGLILMASMSATDQVQQQNELNNAELSLQEASVRLQTLSYQDGDDVASFDLAGRNSDDVRIESNGNLTFQLNGHASCTARMELGSIIYRNDEGQSVAYQAGGVWRDDGSGVSIVSPPDLTYQTDQIDNRTIRSLDFPVVNVQGDLNTASGEVTARQVDNPGGPSMEQQLCLPVSQNSAIDRVRTITITVENNTYYEAWERYLDAELGDSVMDKDVYHGNQTVRYRVPLGQDITPSEFRMDDAEVRAAVWGTGSTEMVFEDSPSAVTQPTRVDSYDSSVAPHSVQNGSNATVVNNGSMVVRQSAKIMGDVAVDGDITIEGNAADPTLIDGSVSYNGTNSTPPEHQYNVTGVFRDNFSFNGDQVPSPDGEIVYTVDSASQVNHNNETGVFNASFSDSVRQAGTVDSGVYFVENFDVDSGEALTFDTSNGDIVVAVNRSVDIEDRVEIHGDGQVRLFIMDDVTVADEIKVFGTHTSPTNESGQLRTFVRTGSDVTFEPGSRFTGVLYAPGADEVVLESNWPSGHSELYGAVMGGEVSVGQGSQVHFDTDVQTASLDSDGDGVPDSADNNNSVPDSDQDSVPNSYDDCPNGDQNDEGVNGCLGISEDEPANALVVNQSRARLTIVGSMVADNRTLTREVGEREPLDVQFAIDDSGSMANFSTTDQEPASWTIVSSGCEVVYIPDGETDVRYNGNWYTLTDNQFIQLCERLGSDDAYKVNYATNVQPRHVWHIEYDDGSTATKRAGDNVDVSDIEEMTVVRLGNDFEDRRVDATQTFVGSLNDSLDEVGVYLFDENPNREHDIRTEGGDFDGANNSVELVDSTGDTNIAGTIRDATDRYDSGSDDQRVIVLLTDGQHNVDTDGVSDNHDEEVRDAADYAHANNVTIYSVALGDGADESLLEEISTTNDPHTNGSMYEAADYTELVDIFDQIAGETTEQEYNVIEYKDTQVNVNVGGTNYPISLNANTPTNDTRPSTVVDIANLNGASDDELEEYVGTLLSAEVTTQACDNVSTFNNVSHDDEEYAEVTCDGTAGTFDSVDNSSSTDHEIYVDGESVPSDADFDTGWFKNESFSDIIDEYESDTGKTLVDDSTGTFDVGQNDAVIVVRTNSSNGDTDYVVMHFEAFDTVVDYDVNTSNISNNAGDPDSNTYSSEDDNSYVISIDESTVEIGNESASIVALPADATNALTAGNAGIGAGAGGTPSMALAADTRARPAV
jgi:flagellin-like protein